MSANKPTRYFSKRQESLIAKNLNGKRQANSGATAFAKGDVVTSKFLIEAKTCTTPRGSFSIKKDWIIKNREEAFAMKKEYSAIAIDFGENENFYIIDEKLFKRLQEVLENE